MESKCYWHRREIGNYRTEWWWGAAKILLQRRRRFFEESGAVAFLSTVCSQRKNAVKGSIKSSWVLFEICQSNSSYHLKSPNEALKLTPHSGKV